MSARSIDNPLKLAFLSARDQGIFRKMWQENPDFTVDLFFQQKKNFHLDEAQLDKAKKYMKQYHMGLICLGQEDYPELLAQISDPPVVLFYAGQKKLLGKTTTIAIVGTRQATSYGLQTAESLADDLTNMGIVVVSGLARGIDQAAHQGALRTGETIAVLGEGHAQTARSSARTIYQEMIEEGLVVSEYPPFYPASKHTFPVRNRIIAGLSRGVIVVESKARGGALITAQLALDYDREVFAVPGRINDIASKGCLQLIRDGAKCLTSAEDVTSEFNWLIPPTSQMAEGHVALSEEEQQVLDLLSIEPVHIDVLAEKGGFTISQLVSALTFLEMKDLVHQFPGKRFTRRGTP